MDFFYNAPDRVVDEVIDGLARIAPVERSVETHGVRLVLDRDRCGERVAVLSGGGAGHEPSHAGFVGRGMLAGAIAGELLLFVWFRSGCRDISRRRNWFRAAKAWSIRFSTYDAERRCEPAASALAADADSAHVDPESFRIPVEKREAGVRVVEGGWARVLWRQAVRDGQDDDGQRAGEHQVLLGVCRLRRANEVATTV